MVGTSSTCWPKNVIFDYIITTPDYPEARRGPQSHRRLYRPYGTMFVLDRCTTSRSITTPSPASSCSTYASEGRVVSTGAPYTNRYISVSRSPIARSLTAQLPRPRGNLDALGWPSGGRRTFCRDSDLHPRPVPTSPFWTPWHTPSGFSLPAVGPPLPFLAFGRVGGTSTAET